MKTRIVSKLTKGRTWVIKVLLVLLTKVWNQDKLLSVAIGSDGYVSAFCIDTDGSYILDMSRLREDHRFMACSLDIGAGTAEDEAEGDCE